MLANGVVGEFSPLYYIVRNFYCSAEVFLASQSCVAPTLTSRMFFSFTFQTFQRYCTFLFVWLFLLLVKWVGASCFPTLIYFFNVLLIQVVFYSLQVVDWSMQICLCICKYKHECQQCRKEQAWCYGVQPSSAILEWQSNINPIHVCGKLNTFTCLLLGLFSPKCSYFM